MLRRLDYYKNAASREYVYDAMDNIPPNTNEDDDGVKNDGDGDEE